MKAFSRLQSKKNLTTRWLAVCGCMVWISGTAVANPTGGQVVGGAATISSSGSTLNINQSSDRAVINWQSFSIANGETTRFYQPNSGSVALNRVVGSNLSEIYGTLSANGKVYLINPNGIIIGGSGIINTAGFVASTLDVNNSQFMSGGNLNFTGNSTASVVNLGNIGVANGDVFLIARQVKNSGNITAKNGEVGLAGGTQVMLSATGSDKMMILPTSGSGSVNNTTSGEIRATVAALKAVGGNEYALAINNGGIVRATGSAKVNGRVLLVADGGTVQSTGTLQARNADRSGGKIETSGDHVTVSGTVDAGKGGTWLIDPNDLTINDGSNGSIDAGTIVSALNGGSTVLEQTTAGGAGGSGDIFVNAPIVWTGTGTLSLDAYRNIAIHQLISGNNGGLTLNAGGTISDTAALSVGTFALQSGNWSQINPSLPGFTASNFILTGGTFLRALGGDGSSGTPYQITDIYGMQGIGSPSGSLLNQYFILANNIDATGTSGWNSGAGFVPIGNYTTPFTGSFDGGGFAIHGLTIQLPASDYVGLFGDSNGSSISNLGLTNVNILGVSYVGGLIGQSDVGGDISNCYTTGTVAGTQYVGGLVGVNNGAIHFSYSSATVSGGLASSYLAGLAGVNGVGSSIADSYATGNITGDTGSNYVAGLTAVNFGTISTSYSTGNVAGYNWLGGLVADCEFGSISNCYSRGSVTGGSGTSDVGGLIGYIFMGTLSDSYSTGAVTGTGTLGRLVGENIDGDIFNCYYALDSGGNATAGIGGGDLSGAVGLTLAQMAAVTNYSPLGTGPNQWDFANIWGVSPSINNGLPSFRWQYSGLSAADASGHVSPMMTGGSSSSGNLFQLSSASVDANGSISGGAGGN